MKKYTVYMLVPYFTWEEVEADSADAAIARVSGETYITESLDPDTKVMWAAEEEKEDQEDVTREAEGEIVDNKAVRKAIGQRACCLYKKLVQTI